MNTIAGQFNTAFRDYATDGVASSGPHDVVKSEVRAIGPLVEAAIALVQLSGLANVSFATKTAMDGGLAYDADTIALVFGDADEANNDLYIKSGASGAGAWALTGNNGIIHDAIASIAQPFVDAALAAQTGAETALSTAEGLFDNRDAAGRTPAFFDDDKNVIQSFEDDGAAHFEALSGEVLQYIADNIPGQSSNATLISDGEGLIAALKKLAIIQSGGTEQVRIGTIGCDSWYNRPAVLEEAQARFTSDGVPMASSGYIDLNPELGKSNGVVLTQSDGSTPLDEGAAPWTFEDGSDGTANAYYSASGNALFTTGNDRTLRAVNVIGEEIFLSYRELNGSFRYRVDGGSWVTVTGSGAGTVSRINIGTGLDDTAPHIVEIDTTVNTIGNEVLLTDLYADGTARAGSQINQIANGEAKASDWINWLASWARETAHMDLDVIIFADGINSQRSTSTTPTAWKADAQAILDQVAATHPNAQVLMITPPRSSKDAEPGTSPMQDYGAKYDELYLANDFTEILRLDVLFGSYAQESQSPDTWDGAGLHLQGAGPHKRYVGAFYDRFFKRYI